jgi:DNA polymerase-3 subunit epsilon
MFRRRLDALRALEGLMGANALCAKLLGLERPAGSCRAYQLGRCRGACVGKEPAAMHALRVRLALSGLKRRDWPFRGAIGIRERDWRGLEEIQVFDDWRHLGTATSVVELEAVLRRPGRFDPDIYRILSGYLERPGAGATLMELRADADGA